jgi:hypothetical protein
LVLTGYVVGIWPEDRYRTWYIMIEAQRLSEMYVFARDAAYFIQLLLGAAKHGSPVGEAARFPGRSRYVLSDDRIPIGSDWRVEALGVG